MDPRASTNHQNMQADIAQLLRLNAALADPSLLMRDSLLLKKNSQQHADNIQLSSTAVQPSTVSFDDMPAAQMHSGQSLGADTKARSKSSAAPMTSFPLATASIGFLPAAESHLSDGRALSMSAMPTPAATLQADFLQKQRQASRQKSLHNKSADALMSLDASANDNSFVANLFSESSTMATANNLLSPAEPRQSSLKLSHSAPLSMQPTLPQFSHDPAIEAFISDDVVDFSSAPAVRSNSTVASDQLSVESQFDALLSSFQSNATSTSAPLASPSAVPAAAETIASSNDTMNTSWEDLVHQIDVSRWLGSVSNSQPSSPRSSGMNLAVDTGKAQGDMIIEPSPKLRKLTPMHSANGPLKSPMTPTIASIAASPVSKPMKGKKGGKKGRKGSKKNAKQAVKASIAQAINISPVSDSATTSAAQAMRATTATATATSTATPSAITAAVVLPSPGNMKSAVAAAISKPAATPRGRKKRSR